MALFERLRTDVEGLRQAKDYPGLIAILDGDDPAGRTEAARALCNLGVGALPTLLRSLDKAGPASRTRMLGALVSVGTPSIPLLLALILRADPTLQTTIARAIASAGEPMFEALLPALQHDQPAIRRATVISLQGAGKKAIPHLTRALHDSNLAVRKEAARVLASLRWAPTETSDQVEFYYLLEDWDELSKLQGAAVPVLLQALQSKDPHIRSESARSLGRIRDFRAFPALAKAAKDRDENVRMRAIEALGYMGDPQAIPLLVDALNDPRHEVRMEAAWALDRLRWVPQSNLQRVDYLIARERWSEVAAMGRTAIPSLIQALKINYSGVRIGATEALRRMGQPAISALKAEASSKDPGRRQRAKTALQYIQRREEEDTLTRPVEEDPSRYERELKEGLAIQKRFEKVFGRPRYTSPTEGAGKPQKLEVEAQKPANSGETANQAAELPRKDMNLDEIIRESRIAEEAWARVKERWKAERSVPEGGIPLENLISHEFEEAIVEMDEAGDEEGWNALLADEETREPQPLEIPEITPETPEEPEPPEPVPEKSPLERYLEALRSSDETVRAAAVAALQGMGKEAVIYLIQALNDPQPAVRIAAAEALGQIGDVDAVDPLIRTTRDEREDVRIAAASALARIGNKKSIQPLIRLFADRYHGVRVAAADAVATFGRAALDPLEEALSDPVTVVRVTAARAVGLIGLIDTIPLLIDHLGDPAAEVRWSVARALAGFGPPVIDPLSLVMRRGSKDMRLAAIDALWEIEDERVVDILRQALDDKDEEVREKAAAALKKRQVIDVWRSALGSQVQEEVRAPKKKKKPIRLEDKKAFERSGPREVGKLISALKEKDWQMQLNVATRLIMMGKPAVDGLIRALRNEDPEIQAAAAGILGEMRETAVEPLMDALEDSDRFVRIVAAQNLGKIGNKRAIEALISVLHRETDPEVRTAVVEGLGYMGSKQAIEPLSLALRDRDERVQIAAARSLGYIGDLRALEPLIHALRDVDDRVRYAALEALKYPDETMRSHLIGALRSGDEDFRAGVAEALEAGGWVPETTEQRVLYLMALNRWSEVEEIGADALPVLAEVLDDPLVEVRANAVRAINRIGGEGSVPLLVQALRDETFMVRKRAERGLIELGETALPGLEDALEMAEDEERERLQRIIDEIRARNVVEEA
jgi:HEAT repeat protein